MKKYFFFLLTSLMVTDMQAQDTTMEEIAETPVQLSVQEERAIYQKVYKTIQDYAQNAAVSDDDEEYYFRKLFASSDMMIGNDLMSLCHEQSISVDAYIAALRSAKSVKVMVKNLQKMGDVRVTENEYTLDIAFEKSIAYSKCGIYFDSESYFGEPYQLNATMAVDKYTGECYISQMSVEYDPRKPLVFPKDFRVVERTPEDENPRNYLRDNKLTIDGKPIQWKRNQVILHDGKVVKYNNSIIKLELIEHVENCGGNRMRAKYNDQQFRIKPNFGYSLMGFNQLSGTKTGKTITTTDGEISFGVDFGYVLPSNSKFFVGFYAGIGLSKNNFSMNEKPEEGKTLSYAIPDCTEDVDGDTYTRNYSVEGEGITQKFSSSEIAIPVYVDFEYQFLPLLSAYANIGVRIQATNDKWEGEIGKHSISGTYPMYDNLIIDKYNINGFGEHKSRSIEVDKTSMTNSLSICGLVGLGLRSNLTKNIAIDAGVQYLLGGNSWKASNEHASVFSYKLDEGDKVNLLTQAEGIKRNALRVTLGLILKF